MYYMDSSDMCWYHSPLNNPTTFNSNENIIAAVLLQLGVRWIGYERGTLEQMMGSLLVAELKTVSVHVVRCHHRLRLRCYVLVRIREFYHFGFLCLVLKAIVNKVFWNLCKGTDWASRCMYTERKRASIKTIVH